MPSYAASSGRKEKQVRINIQKALEYLEGGNEVVAAAARNEGPFAAVSLRRGGDACQLPTV